MYSSIPFHNFFTAKMEAQDVGLEEDSLNANSQLLITDLPDSILLHIFQYLPFSSICQVSNVCLRWNQVSSDELLWRSVFLWHFKLPFTTTLPRKAESWRSEFKRLYYHTPALLVEELKEHKDEVLHVSFSHDGSMFATCSKDGCFMIWSTLTKPVGLLFKMNMKQRFNWQFTQFSQFNESDTCLLVSGVYCNRGPFTTSGEIAIFDLQDKFEMQSRVTNKPYDVFGAWYDNEHLLSGTIYPTGGLSSVSAIWISKASQEVESEVESVSMVLYRFQNNNSSTVRLINVAQIVEARAVQEDTDGLVKPGETLPCACGYQCSDATEPSLLDKLLCREISEEEFDIENEDCDDYHAGCDDYYDYENFNDAEASYKEKEREYEEEPQSVANEREDVLARNLRASGDMEWITGEAKTAFECSKTGEEAVSPEGQHDNSRLRLHSVEAFLNVCDLHPCDASGEDPSNTSGIHPADSSDNSSGILTADSSNNASSMVSENISYTSFNSVGMDSCLQSCEMTASNNCIENNLLDDSISALTTDQTKYSPGHACSHDGLSAHSSGVNSVNWTLSAGTGKLRENSDMPAGQQQLDCLETCELTQNFREDEDDSDESLPAKVPREWYSSTYGESSNIIITPSASCQCDHSNKGKDSEIDVVDATTNSCLGLRRPSEHLQVEDWALSTSLNSEEEARLKESRCERRSVFPQANCSSYFGTSKRNECDMGPSEAASSLAISCVSCDDSLHPGSSHGVGCGGRLPCHTTATHSTSLVSGSLASKSPRCPVSMAPPDNIPQPCFSSSQAFQHPQCKWKKSQACQASPAHHDQRHQRQCKHPPEKLLIYTWGTLTFTPHKVGIKRMKWTDFSKGEVTARRASMLPRVMENLQNGMEPARRDEPDHSFEMHGHIVGLRVAPDQRYLYVNCRPWPKNYIISDPQESPPLAQEVEISTIDLQTFEFVGPVLRSHKAFTDSDDCFFLNLDVSGDFVVSGAEDKQGYLWDRHYGIPLYRFPHNNVVNCVAVNPKDPEMLVTVSDDFSIKVWASRHKHRDDSRHQSHP